MEGLPLNALYFCKPICYKELPYELVYEQECIESCDLKSILNKSCILNYKEEEKIENIKTIEIILDKIENFLTSNDYDVSNIERGNNEVMQYNNMAVTLTTTANQKKDENKKNVTTINLGDCEKKLKDAYNISDNETLFMRKIDSKEEGLMIPKIEFDVYYKLNGTNLVKLNLSYCSNSKIDISIPVKITDNIDKYNSSSAYYNDICYTATSDSGTDIILKDRKKEFMNNNRTVCQENCVFSEYDYNTSKVKCSCNIKESSSLLDIVKIDKQKLFDNFVDINNIGNLNLLFCYKVLFSKKGIIYNYGSYSLILIIIIHLTFIILFYVNNFYGKIQKILDSISLGFNKTENLKVKDKKHKNKEKYNQKKYNDKKRQKTDEKENDSQKPQKNNNKIESKAKIIINNKKNNHIKNKNKISNILNNNSNSNSHTNEIMIYSNNKRMLNNNESNLNKIVDEKLTVYNDGELNDLDYEIAKKCDKRTYCQYYESLLRTNHPLLFIFFSYNDYNSIIIKIDLFLFNFTLFYAINAIFYNDDTMHEIYQDKGEYDFIDQLPQIIYSFLISLLFGFLFEMLVLTEDVILEIKKIKSKKEFEIKTKHLLFKLKIKFLLYFIISTIFLLFFWYYISMFCAIYSNTQIHLIKDSLLSFATSLIEPLGMYLIPGIFRIPALTENKNRHSLYKFSKILQFILLI